MNLFFLRVSDVIIEKGGAKLQEYCRFYQEF